MGGICSICSKPTNDIQEFHFTLCPECLAKTKKVTFEQKVNGLQSVKTKNTAKLSRAERFNFITLTVIIGAMVGVYLMVVDPSFKNTIVRAWESVFGRLSLNYGIIILVLGIILVVVLFRR